MIFGNDVIETKVSFQVNEILAVLAHMLALVDEYHVSYSDIRFFHMETWNIFQLIGMNRRNVEQCVMTSNLSEFHEIILGLEVIDLKTNRTLQFREWIKIKCNSPSELMPIRPVEE